MGQESYIPGIYRTDGGDKEHFKDDSVLYFGDADDISVKWDGTNLAILPVADDTGAIHIGNGTLDIDVKIFLSTATKYVLFDVGNALLTLEDVDLKLGDNDILQFGDAAGGDVSVKWNATNLVILPAADDTGAIIVGDGTTDMDLKVILGAAADYVIADVGNKALAIYGDARIDLSNATIATANTDGGVIKAGTSGSPVTEDTADMKFISLYWDNGAASGDARGIYNRLAITGAGGGGESLRTFTSVTDVAGATAHGAHISLSFGATGTITGLGVAGRNTLHIPNGVMGAGGTYAALQTELYADGANSDAGAVTELSLIRAVLGGNGAGADTGGVADIDDDAYLLVLDGGTTGSGNLVASSVTEANYAYAARCKINGTVMYLMFASAAG